MGKLQVPPADAAAHDATYQPALDAHARRLIARIQRDPFDTEAVLALKAHYEAHGDLPSLTNLMQGWAETLREPDAAADAYVAAGDAALATRDRARARWLYQQALQRSAQHAAARARLDLLEKVARSIPPPPPPRRAPTGSRSPKPPPPISQIRSIDRDATWLDDEDVKPLDEADSSFSRYEETQRIWRPPAW